MKTCEHCGKQFPNQIEIKGNTYRLSGRRFCPDCSDLGGNNRRTYIIALEKGKAFCTRCGQQKLKGEFHKRRNGMPLSYCKTCAEETKRLKYEEKLEKAITSWGGACADCGGVFPIPVFQFVKENRVFQISKAKNMSWERLRKELEEYELLCLNCAAVRKWER